MPVIIAISSVHDKVKLGYYFTFHFPPKGKEVKVMAGVLQVTNLPGEYRITIINSDEKVLESHKFKIEISSMVSPILDNIKKARMLSEKVLGEIEDLIPK